MKYRLSALLSILTLASAAGDTLWDDYKSTQSKTDTAKELGALPESWEDVLKAAKDGQVPLKARTLTLGEHTMPFALIRRESTEPKPGEGRPLYICMHGGGQNDKAEGPHSWDINSREWQSQIGLAAQAYPAEGLFFIPRMADDRLGRWWHALNQTAFDKVIEHGIREWDVDPDRVYILGISEGAYGTDILAPFMADRFAGANAMAGGVGDDVPAENLRNLAFRTDIGENDTMFDRIGLARKFHARLDTAKETDQTAYTHSLNVQQGKGHGVDYRPGVEWMIQHKRNPRPDRIVWTCKDLGGQRRTRFYWLGLEGDSLKGTIKLIAKANHGTNTIDITTECDSPLEGAKVIVLLDDALVDLEKPVTITCNGKTVHDAKLEQNDETRKATLAERGDPKMIFPAKVEFPL